MPLLYVNDHFCWLTGYSRAEVLGKNCRFLQTPGWSPQGSAAVHHLLQQQVPGSVVVRNFRKDGTLFHNELTLVPLWSSNGAVQFYLGVQKDITREVETVQKLAPVDMLTGLPNRAALLEHIKALVACPAEDRHLRPIDVLLMDLDDFHLINTEFGFSTGDACLKLVAERLLAVAPPGALVGRLGGVQFLCVYHAEDELSQVSDLGLAFMDSVERPMEQRDPFQLSVSIGTASSPRDGSDPEVLVRKAKLAMHHARLSKIRYPLPFEDMLT